MYMVMSAVSFFPIQMASILFSYLTLPVSDLPFSQSSVKSIEPFTTEYVNYRIFGDKLLPV